MVAPAEMLNIETIAPPPGLIAWRAQNAETTSLRCANCGVALEGPFCHACGLLAGVFGLGLNGMIGPST